MLLQGPSIDSREKHLEQQPTLPISQLIVHNNIKHSCKESIFHHLSKVRESPMCIYLGVLAIDSIDHNPSSTSAEGLFHGTGISLFQNITEEKPGIVQHKKSIQSSNKMLSQLPSIYADITPVSVYNQVPPINDNYSTLQSSETFATGKEIDKDQRYILKWFASLPSVLFQLFEILHKVSKKVFVT